MLEQLGNLGDFLGGIGVVITLIYLVLQIRQNTDQLRQNTKTVRANGAASQNEGLNATALLLAQDPESRRVYIGGLQDYDGLPDDEKFHFHMILSVYLNGVQKALHLKEENAISQGVWEEALAAADFAASKPGFRPFWSEVREIYPGPFRNLIDERLNHPPQTSPD